MSTTKQAQLRLATPNDYSALAEVMYDAVRHGDSQYNEAQRQAWVPEPRTGEDWIARLSAQKIAVAVDLNHIVGFMSLATDGYIDLAFIRPSARGQGLFRRLYESIEQQARQDEEKRLWTHASLMAQPAFSAMGFVVVKPEVVAIGGQSLKRFQMEKLLVGG